MADSVSPTASRPAPRLVSLDIFRGACALAVFLTHWFLWANFRPTSEFELLVHDVLSVGYDLFCRLTWNSGGQHPAVLGFFVLSGFCIHAASVRTKTEGQQKGGWTRYYLHRGRRILPVYWWGGLLGALFVTLQSIWPSANPMLGVHAAASWQDYLLRAAALSALIPKDVVAGNWSINTVSTEIAIYALYPAILWSFHRLGWWIPLIVLIIAQTVALLLAPHVSPYWLVNTPLMMTAYWYIGMLASVWHHAGKPRFPWWAPLAAWLLFMVLRETPNFHGRYLLVQMTRAIGFAALVLWMVGREATHVGTGTSLPGRFMQLAGRTSYSLYAVHTPVIMVTTWAMTLLLDSRSNGLQLLLTLVASVLAAAFTYRFIERPALKPSSART